VAPPTRQTDTLVSIDVGTSGARATAYDTAGAQLLEVRRPYVTSTPRDGWAEQDAASWRSSALSALGALVKQLGDRHTIHAIGLTGQCPSVVPIDVHGAPLRPGLIYRDNRAVAEAESLNAAFGATELHTLTGHVPAAFHVAAKILWIRANEPDVFRATRLFVQPTELVALTLTGEAVTDWSMAAASALLHLRERRWAPELVEFVGLEMTQLPVPQASWSVVGTLRPALVRRFGLETAIPVVAGAGDSIACALGAGVTKPGPVSEMAGSSTCINTVVNEPTADLAVTHYPSAVGPDGYVTEVGINTAGEALDWLASLTYGGRSGRARASDFQQLDSETSAVAPGSGGLVVVPVLGDGERDDPTLLGAAIGLSVRQDRASLARAVMEGVAFAIRAHLDGLGAATTPATEMRVSGRPASLRTWNHIKADVLGIPVSRVAGDATTSGVAMLAGIGVGIYPDAESAIAIACRPDAPIEPDLANHDRYSTLYEQYRTVVSSATLHGGVDAASTGAPRSNRNAGERP
jgi:xylulokinase